jgi:hypothetical protein
MLTDHVAFMLIEPGGRHRSVDVSRRSVTRLK